MFSTHPNHSVPVTTGLKISKDESRNFMAVFPGKLNLNNNNMRHMNAIVSIKNNMNLFFKINYLLVIFFNLLFRSD